MPLSFFTNSGNSYGSAIPFQRIVEPAQLGMFLNLEQAELLRIQRYNEHWRFYFGKHWIFDRDPFETIDKAGVGELLRHAIDGVRKRHKNMSMGVCGEHGGDAQSIAFFDKIGMDYVSCSPYRVPVARLAAAQARLRNV